MRMPKIDTVREEGESERGEEGEGEGGGDRVMGESSQVELMLSAMLMSSLMLHLYPLQEGIK